MKQITLAQIKQVTADHFGLTVEQIEGPQRSKHIVRPRQIALYCATRFTQHSLPSIGKHFGNKDHTTVLHAKNKITALMAKDELLCRDVATLAAMLEDHKFDDQRQQQRWVEDNINELHGLLDQEEMSLIDAQEKLKAIWNEIGQLEEDAQSLKVQIQGLRSFKSRLAKNNEQVMRVIAATNTYEQAKFSPGELAAFDALLKACTALSRATPISKP